MNELETIDVPPTRGRSPREQTRGRSPKPSNEGGSGMSQSLGYEPGSLNSVQVDGKAFEQAKSTIVPNPKVNPWALFAVLRLYCSCWKNRFGHTAIAHGVCGMALLSVSGVYAGVASTRQGVAVRVDYSKPGSVAAGLTQAVIGVAAPVVTSVDQNVLTPVSTNLAGGKIQYVQGDGQVVQPPTGGATLVNYGTQSPDNDAKPRITWGE